MSDYPYLPTAKHKAANLEPLFASFVEAVKALEQAQEEYDAAMRGGFGSKLLRDALREAARAVEGKRFNLQALLADIPPHPCLPKGFIQEGFDMGRGGSPWEARP